VLKKQRCGRPHERAGTVHFHFVYLCFYDFRNRAISYLCGEVFMKKILSVVLLAMLGIGLFSPMSRANMPTFDAVNAALNMLRNILMQSQFVETMASSVESLNQMKDQYLEMLRFNSGLDDISNFLNLRSLSNPSMARTDVAGAFWGFGNVTPHLEQFQAATGAVEIRRSLETLTGQIPESQSRPYIPFEEMQVVDGFQLAQEIRLAGTQTREAARDIADQAMTASPKGAARLQANALSQMIVVGQENQEALAKLIELQAVQVEQVSRQEKSLEHERVKYMSDAKDYLASFLGGVS